MPWTNPETFTAGQTLTAASMNLISENLRFGQVVCTSTTRPTPAGEGVTIYETDTNKSFIYDGSAWVLVGTIGDGYVSAQSTSAASPAAALIYTSATITLTPGVWVAQASMSLYNTSADSAAVAIYNRTTSAVVAGSYGTPGRTDTEIGASFLSMPTKFTVTSNTDLCPYGNRNGGSSIGSYSGVGAPVAWIAATRVYGG